MDSQPFYLRQKKLKCQKLVLCETEPIRITVTIILCYYDSNRFSLRVKKKPFNIFLLFNTIILFDKEQHQTTFIFCLKLIFYFLQFINYYYCLVFSYIFISHTLFC